MKSSGRAIQAVATWIVQQDVQTDMPLVMGGNTRQARQPKALHTISNEAIGSDIMSGINLTRTQLAHMAAAANPSQEGQVSTVQHKHPRLYSQPAKPSCKTHSTLQASQASQHGIIICDGTVPRPNGKMHRRHGRWWQPNCKQHTGLGTNCKKEARKKP